MNLWATMKEWGKIVSLIEYSTHQQSLDSRENDLIWLLRSENSRFKSTALKALRNLRYRSDRLVAEVLKIIRDESDEFACRVLAAEALGHIVKLNSPFPGHRKKHGEDQTATLRKLLCEPLPPEVLEAIRRELPADESGSRPTTGASLSGTWR